MNRDYNVFISHAGPDKQNIAIPLYKLLRKRNIHAFVDKEELYPGDDGEIEMHNAMNAAPIGVFILSPEFVAREWPMRELICFQTREKEAREQGLPVPILIPVFYRLDVSTCKSKALFHERTEAGEKVFEAGNFIDRAAKGATTVEAVALAMKEITQKTGIVNEGQNRVTNETTDDMQRRRNALSDRIVIGIQRAVNILNDKPAASSRTRDATTESTSVEAATVAVTAGPEKFTPHFEVWKNPGYVVSRMSGDDPNDRLASGEANVRQVLLRKSYHDYALVAVYGMAGVGKTCTLLGLCHDHNIRLRFKDGIYVIVLGADADLHTFLVGLSRAVESSGGYHTASAIRHSQSLAAAVNASRKWFVNRSFLFLLDDVWSQPMNGTKYLDALSRICAAGKESAMVFTTREKQLLSHRRVTHEVCICPLEPRGFYSRAILFRSATGIVGPILASSTNALVNGLLDACGGLPVALAVTGRAIFKMRIEMNGDYDRALSLYYSMQAKSRLKILHDQIAYDEYFTLVTALDTSMEIIDDTRSEEDVARTCYSCAEMHRSLCVLQKGQWVPISVLRRLWKTASNEDAILLAEKLFSVGLVNVQFRRIGDKEVTGILLHDLVHDVVMRNAAKANEGSVWHARLLRSYASVDGNNVQMQNECHKWWAVEREVDVYFDENVVRLLIAAGDVREAVFLVTKPEWIARKIQSCGILAFERDIELLIVALETFTDAEMDPKDVANGLCLVRNWVRAGFAGSCAVLCGKRRRNEIEPDSSH